MCKEAPLLLPAVARRRAEVGVDPVTASQLN